MKVKIIEAADSSDLTDQLNHIEIGYLYTVEDIETNKQFLMIALWHKEGLQIKIPLVGGLDSISLIRPDEFELIT